MKDVKLIMEFMGIKPHRVGNLYCWSHTPWYHVSNPEEEKTLDDIANFLKNQLLKDWNFLMKIVNKIHEVDLTHVGVDSVYETEEFLCVRDELCTGRADTVLEEIVSFIKMYNQNKP
jgi:hypothetical protein